MKLRNKEIEPFIRADKEAWKRYKRSLPKKAVRQIGSSIWKFMEKTAPFVAWFSGILTVVSQIASFKK